MALPLLCANMEMRAQNDDSDVILRPRADEYPAEEQSQKAEEPVLPQVSQFHRLSFQGISMSYGVEPFRRQLQKRGHKTKIDPFDSRYSYMGMVGGQKDFQVFVNYDEDTKEIKNINALNIYPNSTEASKACEIIMANLDKAYPHAVTDISHSQTEQGFVLHQYAKKVLTADGKYTLGSVYLILNQFEHAVEVIYIDAYTAHQRDKVPYGLLDISKIMAPYYDHCFMFVDDNSVDFEMFKGTKHGRLRATGHDRDDILNCVFRDRNTKNAVARLQNYLIGLPVFRDDYMINTSYSFDHPEYYPGGQNLAQQRQRREEMAKNYNFSDFIMEKIFSKQELDYYKTYGTYQLLRNSLPAIFGAVGGNGTTGWDGFNDAQKAVIHEHDNAR